MIYFFQAATASATLMPWIAGSRKVIRWVGLVLLTSSMRVLRFLKLEIAY